MKRKIILIRRAKYYFYKFGIHRILPAKGLMFLSHLSSLSRWIHKQKDLKYSGFPNKHFDYNKRYELYQFIIDSEVDHSDIDYLEFGVSTGYSFKWWVENIKNENSRFFGFDTFTGLPENWGPFKKGDMSNGNAPPVINDSRHTFYQGIFQDTLPGFLKSYQSDKRKIIHLDADLYSATLFVLTSLSPFLKKGDLLIFDEFNVPLHEYKAFKEWVESYYIDYTVLGEVNNFFQVAIKLN